MTANTFAHGSLSSNDASVDPSDLLGDPGGDGVPVPAPFDGTATKDDGGEWVVGMEPGQVIGAGDVSVRTVNLTGPVETGETVTLYVVESSGGSQRFVAASRTPTTSSDETIVMYVSLFRVSDSGEVTQYTRGRLDLNGPLITGEAGGSGGSDKASLSGKVNAKGEPGSGLLVRSYGGSTPGSAGTLAVDIAGRAAEDVFAIREAKDSEGSVLAKFLGTSDFTVGDLPDLDVLKDFTFDYSLGEHKLTVTKTTVNLKTREETTGEAEEVFTAAPHFTNENPAVMTGAQFER